MPRNIQFTEGQRVRIRDWDDMAAEFGQDSTSRFIPCAASFIHDMQHLCGRTATIRRIAVNGSNLDLVDWDNPSNTSWAFSTDMLVPAEPDTRAPWEIMCAQHRRWVLDSREPRDSPRLCKRLRAASLHARVDCACGLNHAPVTRGAATLKLVTRLYRRYNPSPARQESPCNPLPS